MAKDLVRTIMATAGLDGRYNEAYTEPVLGNAKTIRAMLKG
jgi:hypothetical protein